MQRVCVGLEYDGSAYCGWQTQANGPGVQAVVEQALSAIAAAPVAVVCAGRTDAGVHARCQVLHFDTEAVRAARGWMLGTNSHLPPDVSVLWAHSVPLHFHARYSALSRTYRYGIVNRSPRPALAARRLSWIHRPLDAERMREAAASLIGEHDFSAFRAAECQAKSPVRKIERLDVERTGDVIWIEVTANAFLHHMVRNLAGVLIAIGQGDAPVAWAAEVLATRDRRRGAATAPPDGLYLWNVRYAPEFGLPGGDSAIMPPFPATSG